VIIHSTRESSMTEKDLAQGGGGATGSNPASFKDQAASYGGGQANTPYSGSPATQASSSSQPSASTSDIKQKVSEDIRSVQQKAQDSLSDVSDKAKDAASTQKNMIAEKMSGIATAMEKIGGELEQGDQPDIGRMTRNLSSSLRTFSDDIKDRDLGQIAGMAEDFGRKQPLAFLGIAAVAGLAASRFLTASAARTAGNTSSAASSAPRTSGTTQASASSTTTRPGQSAASSSFPSTSSVTPKEDKVNGQQR
jgi:ElaB/YqjD/DUF883 family membrane-anchored ribosome-binding protein